MSRVPVLFSGPTADWQAYAPHLERACAARGVAIELMREAAAPGAVRYVIYSPGGGLTDFSPFTGLAAVLSLWAGVERIAPNPTITVPLCRMVDPGLTEGMTEYVAGHVLRYHLDLDAHLAGQDGVWRHGMAPPLARERTVVLLGLGALGRAAATALAGLGFRVLGWSRTPKTIPGVETRSGEAALAEVLAEAEILVLLLPATPATDDLLDARRLARLPRGARIVNPGRGTLIDDAALLAALDAGRVAHATLDVFREEPLPAGHRYWGHPRVTVTPHIAAETRPATAAEAIAENIRRGEDGRPFLHAVDRTLGY